MEWLYIATLGSLMITGLFQSEEACLGKRDVLQRDNKIYGQCVKDNNYGIVHGSSAITLNPGTIYFQGN